MLRASDTEDLAHYLYDMGYADDCESVHGLTDDPDEWVKMIAERIGWSAMHDAADYCSQRISLAVDEVRYGPAPDCESPDSIDARLAKLEGN